MESERKVKVVEIDPHSGEFLIIINYFTIFLLLLLLKLFQFPPSFQGLKNNLPYDSF